MRRLGMTAILLAGGAVGCVSDDHVSVDPRPVRFYRPLPRSAPLRPPSKQVHRRTPRRPRPERVAVRAPASWYPGKRRISPRWTYIVIHHSATRTGGAVAFDKYHREVNGWDELGYDFVIGNGTDTPDGLVEVGSRWRKQKTGAHCKTPDNYFNEHGIGICLVGDFRRTSPTRRQLASLTQLTRFLSDRCHIPPERITTHGAITHKTQCPGTRFELAALRRAVGRTASASALP